MSDSRCVGSDCKRAYVEEAERIADDGGGSIAKIAIIGKLRVVEPRDADVNGRESGSETEASFVLVDVRSVYVKKSVNPQGISKGPAGGERELRWEVANASTSMKQYR